MEKRLKCPACGQSLSVPAELAARTRVCPFCQNPFPREKQTLNSTEEVLRAVRATLGPEELRKGSVIASVFADLAPDRSQELRLLRTLVDSKGHLLLLDSLSRRPEEQALALEQAVARLTEHYSLDEQKVRAFCAAFLRGMGGEAISVHRVPVLPPEATRGPIHTSVVAPKPVASAGAPVRGKLIVREAFDDIMPLDGTENVTAASVGSFHALALRADGTVVAAGKNEHGECDVSSWRNIVAIATGKDCSFGVREDGSVAYAGDVNSDMADVFSWMDVVAIAAGFSHVIGLRSDGTALAAGDNIYGACRISGRRDLTAIAAGEDYSLGLRANGAVVMTGIFDCVWAINDAGNWALNSAAKLGFSGWSNIIAIAAGEDHALGLRANGRVVSAGKNEDGQRNVSNWRDIVAIAAADARSYGLRSDGTVVAAGIVDAEELAPLRNIVGVAAGSAGFLAIQKA